MGTERVGGSWPSSIPEAVDTPWVGTAIELLGAWAFNSGWILAGRSALEYLMQEGDSMEESPFEFGAEGEDSSLVEEW